MLTQERLRELIEYNPETGIATWKIPGKGRQKAKCIGYIMAGSKRSLPYRYVRFKELGPEARPFTHVVHFYMTGRWPVDEMDHIHGDTLDDRWSEIRECTRPQNEANRGARRNSSTGFKGVIPQRSGRFCAAYWRQGKHVHIGTFGTAQEAHAAYLAAVQPYDGEFARAA